MAVVACLVATFCYGIAGSMTNLIPVFANVFGVIFLDEVVTHWMMGCALVIVAGTALASGLVYRGATQKI